MYWTCGVAFSSASAEAGNAPGAVLAVLLDVVDRDVAQRDLEVGEVDQVVAAPGLLEQLAEVLEGRPRVTGQRPQLGEERPQLLGDGLGVVHQRVEVVERRAQVQEGGVGAAHEVRAAARRTRPAPAARSRSRWSWWRGCRPGRRRPRGGRRGRSRAARRRRRSARAAWSRRSARGTGARWPTARGSGTAGRRSCPRRGPGAGESRPLMSFWRSLRVGSSSVLKISSRSTAVVVLSCLIVPPSGISASFWPGRRRSM